MFADLSARLPARRPASAAVAAGEVDGLPAVLAVGPGSNRLFRWRAGRPADVTPPPLADPATPAVGVIAADVDGDGQEEWYVPAAPGRPDRLFHHGPGGWHDLLADPAHRKARSLGGRALAAFDRRGAGRYTLAVAGDRLRLVEADPAGHLHDAAPALGLADEPVAGVWAGPLVSDHPDLLLLGDRADRLLAHAGDGRFTEAAGRYGLGGADHNRAAAVFDADGRPGLALAAWHGRNRLLTRAMGEPFRDRASPALALPGAAAGVVVADFDNCGHEELLLILAGEPNRLFRYSPDGWRLADPGPAALPDGPATGGCVADLDGDGTPELFLAGDSLAVFHAPNANGWLRVRPLTRFGAPARGATVRLTAGGRTQLRVIDGGPNEPVAHFGLGDVERVEAVAVTWPDGARATLTAPAARRTHTLRHPDSGGR